VFPRLGMPPSEERFLNDLFEWVAPIQGEFSGNNRGERMGGQGDVLQSPKVWDDSEINAVWHARQKRGSEGIGVGTEQAADVKSRKRHSALQASVNVIAQGGTT